MKTEYRKEIVIGDAVAEQCSGAGNSFTHGCGFISFDFALNKKFRANVRKDDPFFLKSENKYLKELNESTREVTSDQPLKN